MKNVAIAILLLILPVMVQGQRYYTTAEYGVSAGASQYFGDLNENYGFNTVNPAFGVYLRKHFSHYIALKAVANFTKVAYDDKFNTIPYQKQRNLNFKSDIYEFAVQAEFNFFKFVTGDYEHRFTPYLTGGFGLFYYNPYTTYKGIKYFLRPLGTEGQNNGYANRKYNLVSPCFPIGAGFKMWLRPGVNLTVEVADRITGTDYLDDVSTTYVGAAKFSASAKAAPARALQDRSVELNATEPLGRAGKQRGNTASFDQYMMAMISLSFHFTTYRCPQDLTDGLIRRR